MNSELHEIIPFKNRGVLSFDIPGSKSISNRALILAALNKGTVNIRGILKSDDVDIMIDCLKKLGLEITNLPNCSTIKVQGKQGFLPARNAELNVGNAGTVARFITALIALQESGEYLIDGSPAMRKRPMAGLINVLKMHGARFRFKEEENCFPFVIKANGLTPGEWEIDATNSSQILSAILLIAPLIKGENTIKLIGETVSKPFVKMTLNMISEFADVQATSIRSKNNSYHLKSFNYNFKGESYLVEPDATAASYFLSLPAVIGGKVIVKNIQNCSLQGDIDFYKVLIKCGYSIKILLQGIEVSCPYKFCGGEFNFNDISDTFLTLAALSPLMQTPLKITGIAHTRMQETDRISAMASELRKLDQIVKEENDSISIIPNLNLNKISKTKFIDIETYKDHRIAMSFGILGSFDLFNNQKPWLRIIDPLCCKKTFPDFFNQLALARINTH